MGQSSLMLEVSNSEDRIIWPQPLFFGVNKFDEHPPRAFQTQTGHRLKDAQETG